MMMVWRVFTASASVTISQSEFLLIKKIILSLSIVLVPLEKEMATHSSILAWEIPGTEDPGGLQSMGLQRVRHDLVTAAAAKSLQSCLTLCDPLAAAH